jgi:hypothetical protein
VFGVGGDGVGGTAAGDHAYEPTLTGKKESPGNLVTSYLLISNTLLHGTVSTFAQPSPLPHTSSTRPRSNPTLAEKS